MGVPILRSDDGGETWMGLDDRVVHVDYQSLYVDPASPSRLLLGNDGGLATSWDGGLTWLELNSVPVGQFYTGYVKYLFFVNDDDVTVTLVYPLRHSTYEALAARGRDVARADLTYAGRVLRAELRGVPFGSFH